jgi:HSP20 family protein
MPFFPRFHYPETRNATYSAFPTDILRLMDGFDNTTDRSTTSRRGFSPNFDVHESEHEYILEGEFPGLSDQKNISIEFTDDNTIYVHGKIERSIKRYRDDQGNIKTIEGSSKEQQKTITSRAETADDNKSETKDKGSHGHTEKNPKFWAAREA